MVFPGTNISGSDIGLFSYIGGDSHLADTKIGKFCSISQDVSVVTGNHPSSVYVSTHPLFFSNRLFAGFSFKHANTFAERRIIEEHYVCIIGHDVWIGEGVKILNGITIGNGAIIGTGSVVTKNVDSYCVMGGVPAKVIRKRFNDEQIWFLDQIQWWDRDLDWIQNNIDSFTSIGNLIGHYDNEI